MRAVERTSARAVSRRRHQPRDQRHGDRAERQHAIVEVSEAKRDPSRASHARRSSCRPRVPSQYISAVPGNIEFFTASACAASGGIDARSR